MPLFWGDLHKHIESEQMIEPTIEGAKETLDFYGVVYYPWKHAPIHEKYTMENLGYSSDLEPLWRQICDAVARRNEKGKLVIFPGYEWHGDPKFGDHNVFFPTDHPRLPQAFTIREMYEEIRTQHGIAIPHHTGYSIHHRGKDWSYHDECLSPLTEIYSAHGSSEGILGPLQLDANLDMGPGCSGGYVQDGLNAGKKFGIIASNEGHGLPGCNRGGLAGIWAEELTRESLWKAMLRRHAIGTTGEKISLDVTVDGYPMGRVGEKKRGPVIVNGEIIGTDFIDRVELVRNGEKIRVVWYPDDLRIPSSFPVRFRIKIECGWHHVDPEQRWNVAARVQNGSITNVLPLFNWFGNRIAERMEDEVKLHLVTLPADGHNRHGSIQGCHLEVLANRPDSRLIVEADGKNFNLPVTDLFGKTRIRAYEEETEAILSRLVPHKVDDLRSTGVVYLNSRKMRIGYAVAEQDYTKQFEMVDESPLEGESYYYMRGIQKNGHVAWASPVWVSR